MEETSTAAKNCCVTGCRGLAVGRAPTKAPLEAVSGSQIHQFADDVFLDDASESLCGGRRGLASPTSPPRQLPATSHGSSSGSRMETKGLRPLHRVTVSRPADSRAFVARSIASRFELANRSYCDQDNVAASLPLISHQQTNDSFRRMAFQVVSSVAAAYERRFSDQPLRCSKAEHVSGRDTRGPLLSFARHPPGFLATSGNCR